VKFAGTPPSARAGHVATLAEGAMFIHGGYTNGQKALADLHRFSFGKYLNQFIFSGIVFL